MTKSVREDLLDDIIELETERITSGKFICPVCKGKDLNKLCDGCRYFNGISLEEIVDKELSKKQILKLGKERKIN